MKTVMPLIVALLLLIGGQSCRTEAARYIDLNTGIPFLLVKDPHTGLMVDAQTGKPLNIYIDLATRDTIDGRTGKVINGQLEKLDKNFYAYKKAKSKVRALMANVSNIKAGKMAYENMVK